MSGQPRDDSQSFCKLLAKLLSLWLHCLFAEQTNDRSDRDVKGGHCTVIEASSHLCSQALLVRPTNSHEATVLAAAGGHRLRLLPTSSELDRGADHRLPSSCCKGLTPSCCSRVACSPTTCQQHCLQFNNEQ
ncbi:hypothetical protein WJX73_003412 [Symbiochloris irregularis]|uniref:Secreted protein n=1 Tax=Symbiochloris irregularis TaxID=706552 RepID=A0AAW1P606_9CHLO